MPEGALAPAVATEPSGRASLHVAGAASGSPLVARLRVALGRDAWVSADGAVPSADRNWRALLEGTVLDWEGPDDGAAPVGPDAVLLDLHGGCGTPGQRLWRVTDATGRAVLEPFFALERCCRPAGLLSLFLVESRDGGRNWTRLGEVHRNAWRSYPCLVREIGIAVVALIASALRQPRAPAPWRPEAPPKLPSAPRKAALWRCRTAYAAHRLKEKFTVEAWGIGIPDGPLEQLLRGGQISCDRWISLPQAEGFVADPFPWPGRPGVLLCERFDNRTGLGRLQALPIAEGRPNWEEDLPLDFTGHLSYPFTWEEDGRVFCLPEMSANRCQVLYELRPGELPRAVATIAEGSSMADATLFRHGGLYWIAYTDTDVGHHDNLCLIWAERLTGPWNAHRGNPVKIDVRSARPAGGLLRLGGDLIRPAQDCARGYGAALVLNRVLACTPDVYQEEPVAVLSPDPAGPYPDGLHTLSVADGLVLIDGKRVVLEPRVLLWRAQRVFTHGRTAMAARLRRVWPVSKLMEV